jgi:hypothetical protein
MKFTTRETLSEELGISRIDEYEKIDKRGFYWMLVGFFIIIGILFLGFLTRAVVPVRISANPNNSSSNSKTLKYSNNS